MGASSHRLTTNNARVEGLSESKLYKPAIEHDRRCVVVCDALYEWKKLKDAGTGAETGKQPYLVFAKTKELEEAENPEANNIEMFAKATLSKYWSSDSETVGKEGSIDWTGPRPLFFAGLYSIWYSDDDRQDRK